MSDFFTKKNCDRCGKFLSSRIMSKMNTDALCPQCEEEEKKHPKYKEAQEREREEVARGNYNYQGLFAGQTYPFGYDI